MPALTHATAIINRRLFLCWATEICRSKYCISWALLCKMYLCLKSCFLGYLTKVTCTS